MADTHLAVILGGADCLPDDLRELSALVDLEDATIVAVNDAGIAYPSVDHWATMHPVEMPARERARREAGRLDGYTTWCHVTGPGDDTDSLCDRTVSGWRGGSSALLAVGVALDGIGCSRVVLCGVPMDRRPHFNAGRPWTGFVTYRRSWTTRAEELRQNVRSMSGWTRDLLGAPDAAWLAAPDLDIDRTEAVEL